MEKYYEKIISDCKSFDTLGIWIDENIGVTKDEPIILESANTKEVKYVNVFINYNFYIQNKNTIDKLICILVNNKNLKELDIVYAKLINDNLKKAILSNKSIENLKLGCHPNDKYNFTYQDYLDFMTSTINHIESLSIDEMVRLLPGYDETKEMIKFNANELIIKKKLSSKEIEELISNFNPKVIVMSDENDYPFYETIEVLERLKLDIKVLVEINDKSIFNEQIFNNIPRYNNIFVKLLGEEFTLSDYLKYEKLLYQMIESAKDLSPFEKYIYAYNITKLFKKYKDNKDDARMSRDLYKILDSEYIVCAGFANLFSDLLTKLGIENHYLVEAIGKEEDIYQKGLHARVYSHIMDEKYGIDGFYRADPTWDNEIKLNYFGVLRDYYNHLAFTDEEATNSKSYLWIDFDDINELFNIKSISEYYKKIEFLKRRTGMRIDEICGRIFDKIVDLDDKYADYLLLTYPFIYDDIWPNDLTNLVNELGNYILSKVNKPISMDTVMKAVEVIYNHSYGYNNEKYTDEDRKELMEIVREMNEYREKEVFPSGEKSK